MTIDVDVNVNQNWIILGMTRERAVTLVCAKGIGLHGFCGYDFFHQRIGA